MFFAKSPKNESSKFASVVDAENSTIPTKLIHMLPI